MNSSDTDTAAPDERTLKIQALNDQLRTSCSGGRLLITGGIRALGDESVMRVLRAVRDFDKFNVDNDPYGEHDFGSLQHDGQTVLWKIDYYDKSLTYGSPDPADPAVTSRVLTVMLAADY